jgi:hypothetical protein
MLCRVQRREREKRQGGGVEMNWGGRREGIRRRARIRTYTTRRESL